MKTIILPLPRWPIKALRLVEEGIKGRVRSFLFPLTLTLSHKGRGKMNFLTADCND